MSLDVKSFDPILDSRESYCASCDSTLCNDVVLVANNVRILLCESCAKQLRDDLNKKIDEIDHYCRKCAYFTPDKYEPFKFDGKCQLKQDAACDPSSTCSKFIKKYPIKETIDLTEGVGNG